MFRITRRLRVSLLVATFAAAADVRAQPLPVVANASDYAGVYLGEGSFREVAVSPRTVQGKKVLILTNLQDGVVRVLFPRGADAFVAGPSLFAADPPSMWATFVRGADGGVASLALEEPGGLRTSGVRARLRAEELEVRRDDVSLRATLLSPLGAAGRRPLVVLVPGSEGEEDRHSLDALPYLLARRGFAVLAYDKRGTGGSGGTWDVSHDVLAADLVTWLDFVAARPDVGDCVTLIGFSEGAWVAPLAATLSPRVRRIVALAGGALPKTESFLHQRRVRGAARGLTGESLERELAPARELLAASAARVREGGATAFDLRQAHDPAAQWAAFRGPVLFLIGEVDAQVPPEPSARRIREVLATAGNPDFTVRVLPRAHHGMFLGTTGAPEEMERLQVGALAPGYLETLLPWLVERSPAASSTPAGLTCPP
jgi:pimeloyl-ACP methyl ester carboxylesterase